MLFFIEGAWVEREIITKYAKTSGWEPSGHCYASGIAKYLNADRVDTDRWEPKGKKL